MHHLKSNGAEDDVDFAFLFESENDISVALAAAGQDVIARAVSLWTLAKANAEFTLPPYPPLRQVRDRQSPAARSGTGAAVLVTVAGFVLFTPSGLR